jgi:predicted nucleotidyltransferase
MIEERDRMDRNRLPQDTCKKIAEMARRHGVTRIRLFGSAARGEAGPDSDVDFLVEA